jgi:DNA-binding transcriptional LysR family regulator
MVNTDQLHYFELVYRERNYSAAARRASLSHRGLVKSIRALETELDVPLFMADPHTGKPIPTPFADELYDFAEVFSGNYDMLRDSFRRLRSDASGSVSLGCSLGVQNAFGPRFLSDFEQAAPNIAVKIYESNDALCEEALVDGRYDLAVVVSPVTAGCEGMAIYRSPMYFWTKVGTPLAERRRRGEPGRVEDLAGCAVAIPGQGFKCCAQLQATARRHGVELGAIVDMSEIFQIYDFVSQGLGAGFSNGTLVDMRGFSYDPDVVAVPMDELTWGFSIERLNNHVPRDAEMRFWDYCVRRARTLPHNDLVTAAR